MLTMKNRSIFNIVYEISLLNSANMLKFNCIFFVLSKKPLNFKIVAKFEMREDSPWKTSKCFFDTIKSVFQNCTLKLY